MHGEPGGKDTEMNRYEEEYESKLMTADEAVSLIGNNEVVGTSQCVCTPRAIFGRLHTIYDRIEHMRMFAPMVTDDELFMSESKYADKFQLDGTFFMQANRRSNEAGVTSFYPGDLHMSARRWVREHKPTLFIGMATPMDRHGYMQISMCQIHERVIMNECDRIILEINPNLPRVYGDTEVHISQVQAVVESENPLPVLPKSAPSELELEIGRNIASLVNDGDCIQLGIGGIPAACAAALIGKRDLGLHTEMIPSTVVELVESGTLTGRRKNLHNGKIIAAFAYGTQELYDMLDENPSVRILSGEYVTNPTVIAANDNFVSINTAMGVDLTGQICSESIGTRQFSGSGGQADTAAGAIHSNGGRSIIAVASTKKKGTVSAITSVLAPGSIVTLSRNIVDYIITEYGIAKMRGCSVRERAENLISIAHPDFRAELRRDAEKFLYI